MGKIRIVVACIGFMVIVSPAISQYTLSDSVVNLTHISDNLKAYFTQSADSANKHALILSGGKNLQIHYFDVLYTIDEEAVSGVFEYVFDKAGKQEYLTLAIALNTQKPVLEYYSFNQSIEKEWKNTLKAAETEKIIICETGMFLKRPNNVYIKYPENGLYSKIPFIEKSDEINPGHIQIEKNISTKSTSNNMLPFIPRCEPKSEVIIPFVPNYQWYLNCAFTSWTMLVGYWNDRGYFNFIPGGNSNNGHYWAVTEELCLLGESSDIRMGQLEYYARATEYGNYFLFDKKWFNRSSYSTDDYWNLYVHFIDSTHNPMELSWNGQPYGAHSTIGVGYKVDEDQRFLIVHDTWRDVPHYVNYDEYFASITGFGHYFPMGYLNQKKSATTIPEFNNHLNPVGLEPLNINIIPVLEPDVYAYHSFELADLNDDFKEDLIICNYRNNTGVSGLKVYYNNGADFVEDENFRPTAEWYECYHISRTFDFDNDGDLDIAVTGYWSYVNLFINEGDHINPTPIVIDNSGRGFIDLEYGDYDLDGDFDLMAASVNGQIRLYENIDENFKKGPVIALDGQSYKIKLSDLNNDHYPDLIASNRSGTIEIFYNSNGTFSTLADFSPTGHGGLSFAVADLNNNGWPDIVAEDDGHIIIYFNTNGNFSDNPVHVNDLLYCYAKDIEVADLNEDNYPEIIVANFNRPNIIFSNFLGSINPFPAWVSECTDPTTNIRIFDNKAGKRKLLFGKSRGGNPEFYSVNYKSCNNILFTYEEITICEGENYLGWAAPGEYSRTFKTASGGDSIVTTNLTVNPRPDPPEIFQSGNILSCSSTQGNQWFINGNIINAGTSKSYQAIYEGVYYVTVTDENGCTSLPSNSIQVLFTSIAPPSDYSFKIFPNPGNSKIRIEGLPEYTTEIGIYDIHGTLCLVQQTKSANCQLDISELPEGIYFIAFNRQFEHALRFIKK
ncbi:MAG: T9SS type A sorting domain-containing protein [Bacteroidales bacterium]|nr:T9SS type A sorting domain-containing protein [Bacteroidales bacterium]